MENRNLFDFAHDFSDDDLIFLPKEEIKKVEAAKPLTPEEIIIKQYQGGMTLKQIVKGNGTSYGRVYEILNRNGVALRSGRYNSKSNNRLVVMSKLEQASLIADYKAGLSMVEILEKYNINKHGCYAILDTAGVPRRQNKNPLLLDINKITEVEKYVVTPATEPIMAHWDETTRTLHIKVKKNRPIENITLTFNLGEVNNEI
jgi:hypothetical protein